MSDRQPRFLALALCVTMISSSIYAGPRPTIAIPPLTKSLNERAIQAIVQTFRDSGDVVVLDVPLVERYVRNKIKISIPKKSTKNAARTLANGQKAYRKLKITEATNLLKRAKTIYRNHLYDEESFQGLRAAQFHLAMAYLASKDRARAKEELREIVLLDPDRNTRKLSSKLYPPTIRNLYKETRDEIKKGESGNIEIKSKPRGALVFMDGKNFGSTPVRIKKVPVGEHFFRLTLEGTDGHFGSKFIVEGKNRFTIELKAVETHNITHYFSVVRNSKDIDHKRAAFLDEMGLTLGADIIIFLSPGQSKVKGQLYDQRSQEVSPIENASSPEKLVAKLLKYLDADGYVASPEEMIKAERQPAASHSKLSPRLTPNANQTFTDQTKAKPQLHTLPWYQNKWIWIGAGAGLLLVGGSVLLLTDIAKSNASSSNITVTIP